MCGSSIKLNSSTDILFLKLFEKQHVSDNVLKLKFDATTNDSNSQLNKDQNLSELIFCGLIDSTHIFFASHPICSGENFDNVLPHA